MAAKPTSTVSENPLAEGMARVTGIDPMSASAGTADLISYDPDLAFRAPEGDIISITGDPGTGASQAETWSHELSLEQMKQDLLKFEYAQQQDLLDQAYQQQQYQLSAASGELASKSQAAQESQFAQNYALQQAENQRAAALSPYQVQAASLANQAASYANLEAARKEQDYQTGLAAQANNAAMQQWLGGAGLSPGASAAWNSPNRGKTYQQTSGNYGQNAWSPYLSGSSQSYGSGIGLSYGI